MNSTYLVIHGIHLRPELLFKAEVRYIATPKKQKSMRVVREIPHPDCKITIFSWNNRYLLKFELGFLEQTYKINEYDVTAETDLDKVVSALFIQKVLALFGEMETNLQNALTEL